MMAIEDTAILTRILSNDEIGKIPNDIYKKVETFIAENFEEFLTSKAVYQAERDSTSK